MKNSNHPLSFPYLFHLFLCCLKYLQVHIILIIQKNSTNIFTRIGINAKRYHQFSKTINEKFGIVIVTYVYCEALRKQKFS